MTVSFWQADGTAPLQDADVLVVGAGIVGCSAAVFAAQAGHHVTLTDARDVAWGATGRNAGFMITGPDLYYHHALERYGHATVQDLYALSRATHAHLRAFAQAGDVPLADTGSLLLAETPEEARDLEAAARAMDADGHTDQEFLPRDPTGRGYCAAMRQRSDAAVHPYRLAQAAFAYSGATLVPHNEVYTVEQPDAHTVIVRGQRVSFRARHVLLCVNAWAAALHPYFAGKVTPQRAQVLVTEPLPAPVFDACGYSDYGYYYYRETFDGRFLVGGARHLHRAAEHDTTDDRTTPGVQASLETYLRHRFPDVAAVPIARRWAGIMGFSVDGLPLVGTLPGMPRVGFAVGFTGHGLATGAATAERAVGHLLHRTALGCVDASRLG